MLTQHSNQTGTVYWTMRCQVTHSLSHSHKPASPLPSVPFAVFAKRHLSLQAWREDHLNKPRHSMAFLSVRLWGKVSFMWCMCMRLCVCRCLCFFMYRHNCCWILMHTRSTCVCWSVYHRGWSAEIEPSALGSLQPHWATEGADIPSAVPLKGLQSHLPLLPVPGIDCNHLAHPNKNAFTPIALPLLQSTDQQYQPDSFPYMAWFTFVSVSVYVYSS